MNIFPKNKIEILKAEIKKALDDGATPIAAFDADGTLWPGDLGESLFHYQIKHNLLPNLPENPYQYYLDYKKRDILKAYLWLAQINEGLPITQVKQWAENALQETPDFQIFEHQKELIAYMLELGVEVYIVTASIAWAVQPGAPLHRIKKENVVGIQTKIIDGLVTTEQEGPITYKQGKVEALLGRTGNKKPFFASGNTEGDKYLLESATHLQLVLASAKENDSNFKTERYMLELAKENKWYAHDFLA